MVVEIFVKQVMCSQMSRHHSHFSLDKCDFQLISKNINSKIVAEIALACTQYSHSMTENLINCYCKIQLGYPVVR